MKHLLPLLWLGLLSTPAASAVINNDFNSHDSANWHYADGWINGSPFDVGWRADHVRFGGGQMALRVDDQPCSGNPALCSGQRYAGGEYRSNDFYGFGRVEARIQAAAGDGLVTSLITYTGPYDGNPHDEIDIEILGKDTTQLQLNYVAAGIGGHEVVINLGFDAAAALHDYAFEWRDDGIDWFVDDVLVYSVNTLSTPILPSTPGRIMMNLWAVDASAAAWAGTYDGHPAAAVYDWVQYTSADLLADPPPDPVDPNLALNKTAVASSLEGTTYAASKAFDGSTATRWSSQFADAQWVYVDLGANYNVNRVKLVWEAASSKAYLVQVSRDATNWTTIYSTAASTGGTQDLTGLIGVGRYVRMYGQSRNTVYGHSLWEMEVYGTAATTTGTANLALNKTAVASSLENTTYSASKAFDGSAATRWSSQFADPQWVYVDLGANYNVNRVRLVWEAASSKAYLVQVSRDATNWTTIYSTAAGTGGTQDLTGLAGVGRYVRMYGQSRNTVYGHSLWEMEVYGTAATTTGTANLALNKTAVASSLEGPTYAASKAFDGSTATRWSSQFKDPQWIYVDLGAKYNVSRVKLIWEAAYSTSYKIQVSNDAATWTDIYSTTSGNGGTVDLTSVTGIGRYVRMYGSARGTVYGHSLWEMEVYGTAWQ